MIDPARLEETLLAVLSYPSPQPEMAAVRDFIAALVRSRAEVAGFDHITVDTAGNLVAARRGTQPDLDPLIWYTYGATYPAAGMPNPYPARLETSGGVRHARGRGAAEQRTGLAAVLEALRSLGGGDRPARGYSLVTNVAGEMGNHLVAESLVRDHGLRAAAVILAVSTGGEIGIGNLGRVDVHVDVQGKPCHSSNPANGINAVDGAVEFCRRLQELPPLPADPDLGQATLAVTAIESEPKISHTIPARCRLTLDRRLVPGEQPAAALAQIAAVAESIAPQRVTVTAGHQNLPGKLAPDSPLPQLALAAARAAGAPARFFYRRAALDAGYFIALGMPAIMWGPGDPALAHTDEERVSLDDAAAAARAYALLTRRCCWDEPGALAR